MKRWLISLLIPLTVQAQDSTWIRINQLGYTPAGIKVAVLCEKTNASAASRPQSPQQGKWLLRSLPGNEIADSGTLGINFGPYGPFDATYRIDFSGFRVQGQYVLEAGGAISPPFLINDTVYKGAADFCLRYLRQQRSGFNPFLRDSCHTHDGYVLYGQQAGIRDSAHIDVIGGWHDASDYLQYSSTSANATYHLLAAFRDFPGSFGDRYLANGLVGENRQADVLDEARWGLDWLLKMHPRPDWLFNQLGDDRDHMGMRIPKEDSFYGRGFERPVYFINGEPQQRGRFLNQTTGTSSTAAKFSSAFSLGSALFAGIDPDYASLLRQKALSAYAFAKRKPGTTQTVSVRSPYIYAEDNWVDDMELAETLLSDRAVPPAQSLLNALGFAAREPFTPWLGADTAKHYQWYPFINPAHYELALRLPGKQRDTVVSYYRDGIQRVWEKARHNAFYRGIPYIWCSNNLTTAFAIQCYWYRQLSLDDKFNALEQANFDWLFGCNPWGTSMVYGLPAGGDTPDDPHSAFTHIGHYPIDGGLVDGPVYGSIYKNLIGITLYQPDEYAAFQSDLAVYHDDYGDYSTNEPTMDGTASLIYLLAARDHEAGQKTVNRNSTISQGAVIRGDSTRKAIALVFTGHEFGDGGSFIAKSLRQSHVRASFFLTGKFYENPAFRSVILQLKKDGHYLGPHSYNHLLYCDWSQRQKLLVSRSEFTSDLKSNLESMRHAGISTDKVRYFLPPYEWYNDSIADWTASLGMQLVNFSPGTLSTADYTTPEMKNYRSTEAILQSIQKKKATGAGLNGFILLVHIGTDPARTDKLYRRLPELIRQLQKEGYQFLPIDELLER